MKHLVTTGLLALALTGCGGSGSSTDTDPATPMTSVTAPECTSGGLGAITALANLQVEMSEAQKAGKITLDQLLAARDSLFKATQAAQASKNWTAYCKAIDDTRAELGL